MTLKQENMKPESRKTKIKKPNIFTTGIAVGTAVLSFGIMGCAPKRVVVPKPPPVLKILPLPDQIRDGYGSKEERYEVYPENAREEKGPGAREIQFPITFKLYEISVYFNVHVTISQLRPETREKTVEELDQVVRDAVTAYVSERGVDLWGEIQVDLKPTVEKNIANACQVFKEVCEYIQGTSE